MFKKVTSLSSSEISKFSTASLLTRTTNDITKIQNFIVMGCASLLKAPIMAVWAIVKIAGKSYQWSLSVLVAILFIIVAVVIIVVFAIPKFKHIQTQTDDVNRVTRENLTGLRVVRAYNAEEFVTNKFEVYNEKLTSTSITVERLMALMSPTMNMVMSGLPLAIYWIGAYLINQAHVVNKLNIFSDMVVFSSYAVQLVMSFVMLVVVFVMLPRAIVSAKRINEVLDSNSAITNGEGVEGDATGTVEFKNVGFKYNGTDEYVLQNISFKANKGDVVAFIGSTGSGKSTLINLVPRFYDATEGEVLVDGYNVKQYDLKELRDKIGYASQKAILFSGSVESNIAFGGKTKPKTEDIENAVDISQSRDFVSKMNGLEAPISQGGKNVSGGQKQRLSIARAIAKKPEILIFDDSFSALDYKTDKTLRAALNKEFDDTTTLLVAQRIGTIKDADLIIVLDEGKIVGQGKHKELLKTCETYKEIALSQLSEEELNEEE